MVVCLRLCLWLCMFVVVCFCGGAFVVVFVVACLLLCLWLCICYVVCNWVLNS